jgi:hypothetical protein
MDFYGQGHKEIYINFLYKESQDEVDDLILKELKDKEAIFARIVDKLKSGIPKIKKILVNYFNS